MQVLGGSFLLIVLSMVAVQALAAAPDSEESYGLKHVTVHQVKNVVGPTMHIDDEGIVSAVWLEEEKETRTVFFARSEQSGGPLGSPVRVNSPAENPYYRQESPALVMRGDDVFITWSLTHPRVTSDKPFSSELRLSHSTDGGRTFAPSVLVNDDGQVINHAFDAIQMTPNGTVHLAWIDGRDGKKDPGTYVAKSTDQGRTVAKNLKISENTCVCCRMALATSADGLIYVAWRKIFDGNVRETVVSRSTDGGESFSAPVIVGNDRWIYPACPHRPASLGVDRRGRLYVVWYKREPTRPRRSIWRIRTTAARRFLRRNN